MESPFNLEPDVWILHLQTLMLSRLYQTGVTTQHNLRREVVWWRRPLCAEASPSVPEWRAWLAGRLDLRRSQTLVKMPDVITELFGSSERISSTFPPPAGTLGLAAGGVGARRLARKHSAAALQILGPLSPLTLSAFLQSSVSTPFSSFYSQSRP